VGIAKNMKSPATVGFLGVKTKIDNRMITFYYFGGIMPVIK
jgi:hypothetical protein